MAFLLSAVNPIETERLTVRELTLDDAPFILTILNDPDFVRYVGDRGVKTIKQARQYVRDSALELYRKSGLGPVLVERSCDGASIGICSLLQRDWLENPDIGFAFTPGYRGRGYAFEATAAVLTHAWRDFGLRRVVAVTAEDNEPAGRLLVKLGFRFERIVQIPPRMEPARLFGASDTRASRLSGMLSLCGLSSLRGGSRERRL